MSPGGKRFESVRELITLTAGCTPITLEVNVNMENEQKCPFSANTISGRAIATGGRIS